MTIHRRGSAAIEFPNDLEIVLTRDFEAPIELVFEVLTKPEHVRKWFAREEVTVCSIDLRVGGNYLRQVEIAAPNDQVCTREIPLFGASGDNRHGRGDSGGLDRDLDAV